MCGTVALEEKRVLMYLARTCMSVEATRAQLAGKMIWARAACPAACPAARSRGKGSDISRGVGEGYLSQCARSGALSGTWVPG